MIFDAGNMFITWAIGRGWAWTGIDTFFGPEMATSEASAISASDT